MREKKNWTWVSNHSQIEKAHCVGMRPRSFARGLFQDWFNSGDLQINFSHLCILSLYVFFFALNDTHWCNIFSLDVAFSTLTSQYCIFYLNGIFDLEVAFYMFIFDFDVTFSALMSQSYVFYFDAAFSNLMTFSSSMLHFLPWGHSFAFLLW